MFFDWSYQTDGIGKDTSEQEVREKSTDVLAIVFQILVSLAWSYKIDGVSIDTPDDKSRQEGPRYRNL